MNVPDGVLNVKTKICSWGFSLTLNLLKLSLDRMQEYIG